MYILTLWLRYLKSRRQAYICIICVMLGVATLIVVNSVMSGFSTKLESKLHAMQSDVIIESADPIYGCPMTAEEMMDRIRRSPANEQIAAMAPSVELIAMLQFRCRGRNFTRSVRVIAVDPKLQKDVGGFAEFLQDEERRKNPTFDVGDAALERFNHFRPPLRPDPLLQPPAAPPAPPADIVDLKPVRDAKQPLRKVEDLPPIDPPPPVKRKVRGAVIGYAIASYREPATANAPAHDEFVLEPGDAVTLYTVGCELEPVSDEFIICDYSKTEMADIDSSTVYVPLDHLQHLRTMEGRVNRLEIKLHDPARCEDVKQQLQMLFPQHSFIVSTWMDKNRTILSAIAIERSILNLLLFMIIGVAGFGILSLFSTIVTEKTRDIGILKSLGAGNRGVLMIFLGYGLLLGLVGAGLGTALGILITENINWIEAKIAWLTGTELFNRDVYYFNSIPTDVRFSHVLAVNVGAIVIAVIFSVWPALKASRLRPVQALRYE